jgi:hypothetical protein
MPESDDNPYFLFQGKHVDNPFFGGNPREVEEHAIRKKYNSKQHYNFDFPENVQKFGVIKKGIQHLIDNQKMQNDTPNRTIV